MTQQTRWAMVGTGFMLELIGNDFARTENVSMQVIVSRTKERAAAAAATYGFPESSDDYEAVLRRDDIDVVYIATPHSEHFRQAMAAIDAGKHVLVEKSMTMSAHDTDTLTSHARERNVFAMEAMWTAFNPAIVELRRRVSEGMIGDVHHVHANFGVPVPYSSTHRLWAKDLAGGSTWDQGVYPLSFAHMILGRPDSIRSTGTIVEGVDGDVSTELGYQAGQRATLFTSLRALTPLSAFIAGTAGCIEVPGAFWNADGFVMRTGRDSSETFTYNREGAGYVPMLRAVSQAVLEGRTEHPSRSHAESVDVARSMDEVVRQVRGQ